MDMGEMGVAIAQVGKDNWEEEGLISFALEAIEHFSKEVGQFNSASNE